MASDLARFRDHCRAMAQSRPTDRISAVWHPGEAAFAMPVGEISDAERDLWRRLADEVDRYLSGADESVETPLFQ